MDVELKATAVNAVQSSRLTIRAELNFLSVAGQAASKYPTSPHLPVTHKLIACSA